MGLLRKALEALSLEEVSDGKLFKEIEHTLYVRLSDLSQLDRAKSMEHQEQWEIRIPKTDVNGGKGSIRIRKTTVAEQAPEYVLTTKTIVGEEGDKDEVPVPTTEAMFNQFKILSPHGMIKDRYFFPVEDSELVWEVDMFLMPGTKPGEKQYHPWAKIDLEVKDRSKALPAFPLEVAEMIGADGEAHTDAEREQVAKLYQTDFITRNQYL